MTPPTESWFDRLAAKRLTRRQGMRVAAAGAAAAVGASLPFARSLPTASAANPNDCRKGCVYMANQKYTQEQVEVHLEQISAQTVHTLLGPGAFAYALIFNTSFYQALDQCQINHRNRTASCFQPNCPGFNPRESGGPCENCVGEFHCNPCAVEEIGYVCCVYAPDDCHGDCCPTTMAPGCP